MVNDHWSSSWCNQSAHKVSSPTIVESTERRIAKQNKKLNKDLAQKNTKVQILTVKNELLRIEEMEMESKTNCWWSIINKLELWQEEE